MRCRMTGNMATLYTNSTHFTSSITSRQSYGTGCSIIISLTQFLIWVSAFAPLCNTRFDFYLRGSIRCRSRCHLGLLQIVQSKFRSLGLLPHPRRRDASFGPNSLRLSHLSVSIPYLISIPEYPDFLNRTTRLSLAYIYSLPNPPTPLPIWLPLFLPLPCRQFTRLPRHHHLPLFLQSSRLPRRRSLPLERMVPRPTH